MFSGRCPFVDSSGSIEPDERTVKIGEFMDARQGTDEFVFASSVDRKKMI
jgi:hypothetical protein